MNTALILIDYENEWINPQSPYYLGDLSPLIAKTNRLLKAAREQGYTIIFTRHIEKGATDAFVEGSAGVELIPQIDKAPEDTLITKYKISPFYMTSLEEELKGVDKIIVCGILTNLCVRMTVEEAYDREFDITLIRDCCTSFDKQSHEFTIQDLTNTRPEVKVVTLEELF